MNVFDKRNTARTAPSLALESHMLIGRRNTAATGISIQISDIPVNSAQPLHRHAPEQCYYIVKGKGVMVIEGDERTVEAGDAVYIASNREHGIRNIGEEVLQYVTANSPAFEEEYEKRLWPVGPGDGEADGT